MSKSQDPGKAQAKDQLVATPSVWKYEGECNSQCVPHGSGKLSGIDSLGSFTYTGQFSNGQRSGVGLIQWSSGQVYEGQWLNDKPHGMGSERRSDFRYVGGRCQSYDPQ
jgi:hypothetical protein